MPANLENAAVATGLEKDTFHSNPKEANANDNIRGNSLGIKAPFWGHIEF